MIGKLIIGLMAVVQMVNMVFVVVDNPTTPLMIFHSAILVAIVVMFVNLKTS